MTSSPRPTAPATAPATAPPALATATPGPAGIDPRGQRFGGAVNVVLLVVVLLLPPTPATALLVGVALLFALGTVRGAQGSLQGLLYRRLVRPRLAPPAELEDPRPPRFAQVVGLVITGVGALLGVLGIGAAVPVAAALALVAAFLNAAFGLCLGCELYLLAVRLRARQ